MYAPHNQRVLFVDDEEGVRRSWNRFLTERGFDVVTAEDGERAIARLREKPVDVVVSDLRMPGLDGLQLLQWTHDKQPDTRFILFTGFGNAEVERRARELGVYEYLNKPMNPDTLAAVITAATHLNLAPRIEATATPAIAEVATVPTDSTAAPAPNRFNNALKITAGLIVSPILGLAFVLFLPVIGFALAFRVAGEAIAKKGKRVAP